MWTMPELMPYSQAKSILDIQEKIGQLFMPAAFINDTEEEIRALENLIREHAIGGLCFFHSRASAATNFEGKKKVIYNEQSFQTLKTLIQRYQKAAKYPLLISIDAEWGLAMRIENTPQYPYAITLGALEGQTDLIYQVGKNIAHDCKQAGIHWNLAPVVDINNNLRNPVIGYRSFGEDRHKVVEKATAFMAGTKSEGILSCIKHFPGHGDTDTDSHLGLPHIHKSKTELWDNELYPFLQLIQKGTDAVMVGHLIVPALSRGKAVSATLSKDIIQGILRDEMGFQGVVISDALNMHSVSTLYQKKGVLEWTAFEAGNDILCFAEHPIEGIRVILKNATTAQIEERFARVWALKEKSIRQDSNLPADLQDPKALNSALARESLSFFKGTEKSIQHFRAEEHLSLTLGKGTSIEALMEHAEPYSHLLLNIVPPQIKPTDNFGLSDREIKGIQTLINTKKVVLYLFGNPYVLNLLDVTAAEAVVLVYQKFKEFKENAQAHFMGEVTAMGKVPVSINSQRS